MKKLTLTLVSLLTATVITARAESSMDDAPVPSEKPAMEQNAPADSAMDSDQQPVSEPPVDPVPTAPSEPQPVEPPVTEPPTDLPGDLPPPDLTDPTPGLDPVNPPEPLPIVIGEAGFGGPGCTPGNIAIDHDDQGRITIVLAPMVVDGSNPKSPFARTACSVRLPVSVPPKTKLAIVEVSNHGHYHVDHKDSITVSQESGFVGTDKGPQELQLSSDGDGVLSWDSSIGQLAESSCNRTDHILALNTSALLKKSKSSPTNSHVALESTEIQLTLEPCPEE